ncbi:hypothetical protein VST7929_02872 [Vibrio stylophorae]|uniref:DUF5666 domain-containing protein n=1 Tax=Vibrio stylophorae TaxID=659351 RepID=A0ABN8DYH1_9VIBR|nr:DUF5666 domain-containing protein [Vibrio stylophorae]CAH0535214.1 hypothetical protein VST7929_02872 [Vibrio stylophorae]
MNKTLLATLIASVALVGCNSDSSDDSTTVTKTGHIDGYAANLQKIQLDGGLYSMPANVASFDGNSVRIAQLRNVDVTMTATDGTVTQLELDPEVAGMLTVNHAEPAVYSVNGIVLAKFEEGFVTNLAALVGQYVLVFGWEDQNDQLHVTEVAAAPNGTKAEVEGKVHAYDPNTGILQLDIVGSTTEPTTPTEPTPPTEPTVPAEPTQPAAVLADETAPEPTPDPEPNPNPNPEASPTLVTFVVDSDTEFDDGTEADLVEGALLEVEFVFTGDIASEQTALEIDFEAEDELSDELEGIVTAYTPGETLELNNQHLVDIAEAQFDKLADQWLKVGMRVEVELTDDSTLDNLVAEEVEVETASTEGRVDALTPNVSVEVQGVTFDLSSVETVHKDIECAVGDWAEIEILALSSETPQATDDASVHYAVSIECQPIADLDLDNGLYEMELEGTVAAGALWGYSWEGLDQYDGAWFEFECQVDPSDISTLAQCKIDD